jgi:L-amino acid N-acyltransferase
MINLRQAQTGDVPAICAIFNHYILHSTASFYTETLSESDRLEWLESHSPRHPVLVAEDAGTVVGWAALSEFKTRQAYAETVEISVYVRADRHRQGIGRQLMAELIARARQAGFHTLIAATCAEQTASLSLQRALGFRQAAYLAEVGRKFGRWLDIVYCQLMLAESPAPLAPPAPGEPDHAS